MAGTSLIAVNGAIVVPAVACDGRHTPADHALHFVELVGIHHRLDAIDHARDLTIG